MQVTKNIKPLERIASLGAYTPGLSIAEIQAKYGLPRVIKMASNENPLGASPLAQEAIRRHADSAFRYPQGGNPRLCKALAEKHGVSPDKIVAGNGSDEIIDGLIRITCEPGKHNIVCNIPCFSIYPIQAKISGVECRRLPLKEDFSFDFEKIGNLVDENTRLVFLTTPDNPSGYCPAPEAVRALAKTLGESAPQALLVIDEAYMDFAPNEKTISLLASGDFPENVGFLRTFSKSYGLAGLRLGYGVLPPALAESFWRARLPFSINLLAEEAGLAALQDWAFREVTLQTVAEGRQTLKAGLEELGCLVWPSAANFLMFQLPAKTDAKACFESLLRQGVIIRPLNSYNLPDHLRVSIGNPEENKLFLKALGNFLAAA